MTRTTARAALIGAAITAAILTAGPAHATDATISINGGNVPTTAADYGNQACETNQGGGPFEGQDVWVFVLPGEHDTSGDFVSITANFDDGDVTINAADSPGNFGNGGPETAKAWIVTDAGRTLTGATATITGTAESFNLTHTCPASDPSPSPTPSVSESPSAQPSSPAPSDPASSAPPSVPASFPVPSGPVGAGGGMDDGGLGLWLQYAIVVLIVIAGFGVTAAYITILRRRSS